MKRLLRTLLPKIWNEPDSSDKLKQRERKTTSTWWIEQIAKQRSHTQNRISKITGEKVKTKPKTNNKLESKTVKTYELSDDILDDYNLWALLESWTSCKESVELKERRRSVRLRVESILREHQEDIKTKSKSSKTLKVTRDKITNISSHWMQIESKDLQKEVWELASFEFKIGNRKFSILWEIKNIIPSNNEKIVRYWVEFKEIWEEEKSFLVWLVGSIKLVKYYNKK